MYLVKKYIYIMFRLIAKLIYFYFDISIFFIVQKIYFLIGYFQCNFIFIIVLVFINIFFYKIHVNKKYFPLY